MHADEVPSSHQAKPRILRDTPGAQGYCFTLCLFFNTATGFRDAHTGLEITAR